MCSVTGLRRWIASTFDRALAFVLRLRFRYDFFVSYSRTDQKYARALLSQLRSMDFHCFFDDDETYAGQPLTPTLRRALRTSAYLIIVGTPGAVESEFVAFEAREFAATGRTIIPIIVDCELGTGPWNWLDEKDPIRIAESADAIARGVVLYPLQGHQNLAERAWFADDGAAILSVATDGHGVTELIEWDVSLEYRPPEVVAKRIGTLMPSRIYTTIGRRRAA